MVIVSNAGRLNTDQNTVLVVVDVASRVTRVSELLKHCRSVVVQSSQTG